MIEQGQVVSGEVNFPEATEALKVLAEESRAIRANLQEIAKTLEFTAEQLVLIVRKL